MRDAGTPTICSMKMKTLIKTVSREHPEEEVIEEAARILREGGLVAFPTETVYGLGGDARNPLSSRKIYAAKGRPSDKPVAWLVRSEGDIDVYGADVPEYARRLVQAFWPGALTIIVRASDAVPRPYQSQAGTIGLRMPDDELTRAIATEVGCPLAVTSANLSGQPDPHRFEEIDSLLMTRVAAAIDDSRQKSGIGSTVLDCTTPTYRILREGSIKNSDIAAALTPVSST